LIERFVEWPARETAALSPTKSPVSSLAHDSGALQPVEESPENYGGGWFFLDTTHRVENAHTLRKEVRSFVHGVFAFPENLPD
jgi:hypothetical protein